MARRHSLILALASLVVLVIVLIWQRNGTQWKAGIAVAEITPKESMWLSGYASRDRPSEGTLTPLWAKALALEDQNAHRILLITLELIGIDRALSNQIRDAIHDRHGLTKKDILINSSHTHTGPIVGANLRAMYALTDKQSAKVDAYSEALLTTIVDLTDRALTDLQPAKVCYGEGEASFAVNRRNNPENNVLSLRSTGELKGPVDHAVPVIKVESRRDSSLMALVFGYACHATVLSSFEWSGDYPGFAQAAVEDHYPGATALFWAGCGADQNPLPRREVSLAKNYGNQLAEAVIQVVDGDSLQPLLSPVMTSYSEIRLPFADVPERVDLESLRERSEEPYQSRMASFLLNNPEIMTYVQNGYPYPIQTWRFGKDLTWISLGGEVVVDYALTLKQQLGSKSSSVWVAGYSNDVMAYIPSLRVLNEGGYEGGGSMVYYGLPSPWAADVQTRVINEVNRQHAMNP